MTETAKRLTRKLETQKKQRLLEAAQTAQTAYWRALGELEAATGYDLDSTRDLQGLTLKTLKAAQHD